MFYRLTSSCETHTDAYRLEGDPGPLDRVTHIVEAVYLQYVRPATDWKWTFDHALLHGRDHRPNGSKGDMLVNNRVTQDYLAAHHPDIHAKVVEFLDTHNQADWR